MTDEMLKVARTNAPIVAERVGYKNVEFRGCNRGTAGLEARNGALRAEIVEWTNVVSNGKQVARPY